MSITFLSSLICIASLLILSGAADCPEECVCMWKNGKETTECINRDKDAIPSGIEPSTQVLDLRGNNIRVLSNDIFVQMSITNLQRFYCSYCQVSEVEPQAFRRLTNLVDLDLSENLMREVPAESWKHTKALMKLNLSGNPIKLIRSGAFTRLKFVTNLALSHCDIETVEKGAFEGMERLLELKLDSNNLQHLSSEGLFPKTLHHVEVSYIIFRWGPGLRFLKSVLSEVHKQIYYVFYRWLNNVWLVFMRSVCRTIFPAGITKKERGKALCL